jgi:hypothetical protein
MLLFSILGYVVFWFLCINSFGKYNPFWMDASCLSVFGCFPLGTDFFPGDFDYLRTKPPNPSNNTDGYGSHGLQAEWMMSMTALLILFVAASFTGVYLYQRRSHLNKQKLKNLKVRRETGSLRR